MLSTPIINKQQIKQFKQDGFLLIKNAFNQRDMTMIASWATELGNIPEKSGEHWVYHEKSKVEPDINLINRIENITPFHHGFAELSDTLKEPMAQLFDEEAVLFKEK